MQLIVKYKKLLEGNWEYGKKLYFAFMKLEEKYPLITKFDRIIVDSSKEPFYDFSLSKIGYSFLVSYGVLEKYNFYEIQKILVKTYFEVGLNDLARKNTCVGDCKDEDTTCNDCECTWACCYSCQHYCHSDCDNEDIYCKNCKCGEDCCSNCMHWCSGDCEDDYMDCDDCECGGDCCNNCKHHCCGDCSEDIDCDDCECGEDCCVGCYCQNDCEEEDMDCRQCGCSIGCCNGCQNHYCCSGDCDDNDIACEDCRCSGECCKNCRLHQDNQDDDPEYDDDFNNILKSAFEKVSSQGDNSFENLSLKEKIKFVANKIGLPQKQVVRIIKHSSINAFTNGVEIAVTDQAINTISEEELVHILGHEQAHIDNDHVKKRIAYNEETLSRIKGAMTEKNTGLALKALKILGIGIARTAEGTIISHAQEIEADLDSQKRAKEARYSGKGGAQLINRFGVEKFQFSFSHPSPNIRKKILER